MSFDLFQIQSFEQVVGAVSATRTNDGVDIVPYEHFFQFASAAPRRTRKIKLLRKDGIEIERAITGAAQGFAACLKFRLLDVAGGRDNTNGIAGAQCRRSNARDGRG